VFLRRLRRAPLAALRSAFAARAIDIAPTPLL